MRRRLLLSLAAALLLAGCGARTGSVAPGATTPAPVPAPAPAPGEFRKCGQEMYRQGEGYDGKMRDCFWQAVSAGEPVTFATTVYTTEGDPIAYVIQARAPSHGPGPRFTVLVDSRDRFGEQGKTTHACRAMERVAYQHAPEPDSRQRYGFRLSDCTGGDTVQLP